MSEELSIAPKTTSKEEAYRLLLSQLKGLIAGETDLIANLGNIAAGIKQTFGFLWSGFYFVKGNELVLGPFQGPVACTRIGYGKGVCGSAWKENKTIIVPDVDAFPGHIACSSESRSEIVIPAFKNGMVFLVLDIDSEHLEHFDETDKQYLENLIRIIEGII